MAAVEKSYDGFCEPSSIPLGKHRDNDPLLHVNQLQFNLHAPYSINALASNFGKPQPLLIEKFPVRLAGQPEVRQTSSISSSLASSVVSDRMHFAIQLAKIDAKKLWREQKEKEELGELDDVKVKVQERRVELKGKRRMNQDGKRCNVGYEEFKSKKDSDVRRNIREPPRDLEDVAEKKPGSEERLTREIKRLESQIQNYLQRLDGLFTKGDEVLQKKGKRHRLRSGKDHLSDEDTDPRQNERAEEQAARSARVLYMIEKQIRELNDEIHKKGRNMKETKKSQTLSRLAAAQRATVRALRMLINTAPLQPKRSQHTPSIYQALTTVIQQLSLLSTQIEDGDVMKMAKHDFSVDKHREPRDVIRGTKSKPKQAFSQEPEKRLRGLPRNPRVTSRAPSTEAPFPGDLNLTVDATPERNAMLKAGVEALLKAKEFEKVEKKRSKQAFNPYNAKKKAVLLQSNLQAKRRRAHTAAQKNVKFSTETAHFTKETKSSRLKKVERQTTKDTSQVPEEAQTVLSEAKTGSSHDVTQLREREVQSQSLREDESSKNLREVMNIPKSLVSEAEKEIRMKLKPILEEAQAVVNNSKSKPVQERFANIASKVTMKQNEVLSEMILDDLLIDTAQEFQRLERNKDFDHETSYIQDNSTLENILERLQRFENEEENIRRRLSRLSYSDKYETKQSTVMRNREDATKNISTDDVIRQTSRPRPSKCTEESTEFRPGEKHPVLISLSPEVREGIFSHRKNYSKYLEQNNAEHHGTFNPWQLVERLSDEILNEVILEVASEFTGACDDITEMIFKSEFMKE